MRRRQGWCAIGIAAVLALPLVSAGETLTADRSVTVTGGLDDPKGAGAVSSGVALPPVPKVTGSRRNPVPSWGKPLPYPILIADRRNNRLLEVTPDQRIVWEFPSPNLTVYSGNEDVSFSPDGLRLAVSEEDNYDVHIVDYEKRELTWTYGVPEKAGHKPPYLNYPDTLTSSRTASSSPPTSATAGC
jgi:hypothetical protein